MTDADRARLIAQVKVHEGWKDRPYRCTANVLTIGYGTNLDDGIDRVEGEFLLNHRLEKCRADLQTFPWFAQLDAVRQMALLDMRYQLGPNRFRGFRKMLAALARLDFREAAKEARDSKWAKSDSPNRARTVTRQLETGQP